MHRLLSFLACPLCPRNSLLKTPSTLPCGHSICSSHLPAISCPVPSCRQPPPPPPSSSSVSFFSAPPDHHHQQQIPDSHPKFDVTINKLLDLFSRPGDEHDNDDSHSDPPSTHRQRSSSASSERPRKRRRRSHSTPLDSHEPDLLQHLRQQSHNRRNVPHDAPLLTSPDDFTGTPLTQSASLEKELLSELKCEICFMLFYQPITTPCQHTFCYKCLHRSLDHSSACPLCRQDLPSSSYFLEHPCNKVILALILNAFPALYTERGESIAAEERDARLDTPIFVGQLSFPGMPTLLHFFEPRYRLMLRRCLETPNPRFGIVMPPRTGNASSHCGDYGTMVEIRTVRMLPDGRSLVETIGSQRFRLLERGTFDGYTVGRTEIIEDFPDDLDDTLWNTPTDDSTTSSSSHSTTTSPSSSSQSQSFSSSSAFSSSNPSTTTPASSSSSSNSSSVTTTATSFSSSNPSLPLLFSHTPAPASIPAPPTNTELMSTCHVFLAQLQQGMAPWVIQRLNSTYGHPPNDASAFSFYVAFMLPIDEHEKAKLLPVRSAQLRLRLVVHWIHRLNNNWWFSNGCVIL